MWPFKRKPVVYVPPPKDPVVTAAKRRIHVAATSAQTNTDNLNDKFRQNGITLNILKVAGGKSGH